MAKKFNPKRKFHGKKGKDEDSGSKEFPGSKETEHKYNDVSWYTKNTQMLQDAASYSYNNALGSPVHFERLTSRPLVSFLNGAAMPGLMAHYYMIGPGVSNNDASPANIAGQNIYAYVRFHNSGAKNYDQQDMLMYLLSMDSLYMQWNWLKRIYGYLRTYSQYNRYMPKVYAEADGIDFDDFSANMADLRLYLNQSAAKLSAFCVPAVMPLFVRHSWMASNIYKDSDDFKAQQYMFVPAGFYMYDESTSPQGGFLKWSPRTFALTGSGNKAKFADVKRQLDGYIQQVSYSEDVGIMSGDILKAYGEGNLFKLSPVDPDYTVLPVYNEEVLNQMHNSNVVDLFGTTYSDTTFDIRQDPNRNYLIWQPKVKSTSDIATGKIINMPWDNVTPENTMVGTRLVTTIKKRSDDYYEVEHCGSEILIRRAIFCINYTGTATPGINIYRRFNLDADELVIVLAEEGNTANILLELSMITQFDWHPLFKIVEKVGTDFKLIQVIGDISNYTVLSNDDFEKLHYTAIMSEFNIPQLGTF